MIDNNYFSEVLVVHGLQEIYLGDLVTTILEEYGIIVGFGKHPEYDLDQTEYCYVLIGSRVYNYMTESIKKVIK
jgi:hypothetical protein|tara:strand:+ start:533 stop:754 length:222 start_codon:yes stop_codon:yes gene_type:complete